MTTIFTGMNNVKNTNHVDFELKEGILKKAFLLLNLRTFIALNRPLKMYTTIISFN
jgi:hypothetical protein